MNASRLLRGAITESRVEQRRVVLVVLRAAERHGWPPAETADVLDALGLLSTARRMR